MEAGVKLEIVDMSVEALGSPNNSGIGIPLIETLELLWVHELSEPVHRADAPLSALLEAQDIDYPHYGRSPVRTPIFSVDVCQGLIVKFPV